MNIKMILKVVFIAVLSLFVAACSSQSAIKANYYLLNEANSQAINKTQESVTHNGSSRYISVNKIRLSNYLSQPNIAMQLKDHQLYYSNSHLWAEQLDSGISKSLLKDLNQKSSSLHFVSHNSPVTDKASVQLTVEIEHFISTVNSEVILSGQFWLVEDTTTDGKMNKSTKRNFNYSLALEKDGYPHSVAKMRQLLTLLSAQIEELCEEQITQ